MIYLGINAYHPDASVALFKDGVLVWAGEEERYNRIKHASGFPDKALMQCLKETGIKHSDLDAVAISKNPQANFIKKVAFALITQPNLNMVFNRARAFTRFAFFRKHFLHLINAPVNSPRPEFINVEHHQAHIASSFFLSGFDRAAFLSLDGLGDFSSAMWGMGEGNKLKVCDRVYFPHSAGFFYTAATQFLGFLKFGDEYKVMGLAAYGKPALIESFRMMYRLKPKGQFKLNLDYFLHHKGQAKIRWEGGIPDQDILYSAEWIKTFGEPRQTESAVTQREMDIAASLQVALEDIYFHILNHLYSITHEDNLCLAGGVAFNSVANGKITRHTPFRNIYIQPAAGDAGTAVGAAAYVAHALYNEPRKFVMNHVYFGSDASRESIVTALRSKGIAFEEIASDEALVKKTAKAIAEGKVIGWFQGKMEFGPRALGNRSILADPRRPDMKDILNQRIKHRETFRPFAPTVTEESAPEFFEMDCASSPFMLKVFPVRHDKRKALPAITHLDGTARVQTVAKESNPLFWKLLTEFGHITGIPVLLNTSFNENEPIVCTPEEALDCYIKTKMDMLVIGHCVVERKDGLK